jgi:hypothetical protein
VESLSRVAAALQEQMEQQEDRDAIVVADREAFMLLVICGAVRPTLENNDDRNRAFETVGGAYGLAEARESMRAGLKERGIDLDSLSGRDEGELDGLILDFEQAAQHGAYMLGIAVGIRLAAGAS